MSGALKAYCNVNEVISCIMLNWIVLYGANMLLSSVKETSSPYTIKIPTVNEGALIPKIRDLLADMGIAELSPNLKSLLDQYVTIAIPLALLIAIAIAVLLSATKLGYELKATGLNKHAAKYAGMREKYNIILTMGIAGALAGIGAAMLYLTGFEQWSTTQSSVPAMGFNGIAAAFLGGLNPIGAVLSSVFIQHITIGGAYVDKTMYSAEISSFIASVIIYLCGFVLFFKHFMNRLIDRREEKKALKGGDGK